MPGGVCPTRKKIMSARFFGRSEQPLFGTFHPARGRGGAKRCVLLCPPLGHELIRSHWAIRNLAAKLTRKGINVFRFDYRGTGDSAGDIEDVASLQELVEDALTAAVELLDTVNDPSPKLSFAGLRLGGVVAAMAAKQLADNQLFADATLCWDCPRDGETYLRELRAMHGRMIDLWTSKVATEKTETHEEILGFRYQSSLLKDIQQFRADDVPHLDRGELQAIVSGETGDRWHDAPAHWSVVQTDDPSDWSDLNYIEEAWLPIDGSSKMVELLQPESQPRPSKRAAAIVDTSVNSADTTLTPVVA